MEKTKIRTLQEEVENLIKTTLHHVLMKYIRTPDIASHFADQAVSVKSAFNQQETFVLSRGNVQGAKLTKNLLFKLIRYTSSIGQPTKGWDNFPAENNVTCADDVVRLSQQHFISYLTFESYETICSSIIWVIERLTNGHLSAEINMLKTRLLYYLLTECADDEFKALLVCLLLSKDGYISVQNVAGLTTLLHDVRLSLSLSTDGVNSKCFTNEHTKHFVAYIDGKIFIVSLNAMDSAFLVLMDIIESEDFQVDICSVNETFLMRYCRTAGYRKKPGELCFNLKSSQTNLFVTHLGLKILDHPSIQDTETHGIICRNFSVPPEVSRRGREDIITFVKHLKNGKQRFFHARGMVVGCSGTGKTSLLNRIQEKLYLANHEIKETQAAEVNEHMFSIENGRLNVRKLIKSMIDLGRNTEPERKWTEKTISMLEFAGQWGYYACHQIYFNCKSFFIFVMDPTKPLDAIVEDTANKGTLFENWTYKDFFLFWMKSIHTYSNKQAPVILVWTHADVLKNGEEEISKSFGKISETLIDEDPDLLQHISKSRCFWIGFPKKRRIFKDIDPYKESVQEIKKCIMETSEHLEHWGLQIPTTWAKVQRNIQEARNDKKVLKIKDLWEHMDKTFRLKEESELIKILTFYHEVGEILYFPEAELKDFAILDIQWFVDAFRYIITDLNHASLDLEDERRKDKDYKTFVESGELSDRLLNIIWGSCKEKDFLGFRKELVLCMKRLGLLTNITVFRTRLRDSYQDRYCWYVPCMNRKTFDCEDFKSYTKMSSILCFEFQFFPNIVFYKLILSCVENGWNVLKDNMGKSLYQTVAIFYCFECFVFVGICKNLIEVQVRNMDAYASLERRYEIFVELRKKIKEIAENFHEKLDYGIGYKCNRTKFCDPSIAYVIRDEQNIQGILCTMCPVTRKHHIYKEELTWNFENEFLRHDTANNAHIVARRVKRMSETRNTNHRDSELVLDMVAAKIPRDSEMIATSLHVEQDVIDQIIKDNPYFIQEANFQILYHWRNKRKENMKTLRAVLSENGRQDVVDAIQEFDRTLYRYHGVIDPEIEISSDDIILVSRDIGRKYVRLARFLRLPQGIIERIKTDHQDNLYECTVITLSSIRNVTRQDLCDGLLYLSRMDIIEELIDSWLHV